jgi:hypothetical protein
MGRFERPAADHEPVALRQVQCATADCAGSGVMHTAYSHRFWCFSIELPGCRALWCRVVSYQAMPFKRQ